MGNEKTESTVKKSWFDGLKAEFAKIIWPTRETTTKQTIAVVAVTVVVSILIAVIDTIVKYGIDFIVGL
ncbi:MAG: preprotein translocase subunit SecE [Eubacterium sp.]|nr:preprotein translocase subunit SecE [Eubacterium sp.]